MKHLHLFLFLFILLLFSACSENETLEESILIQNDETIIQAIESEDFITIHIESLIDITDNRLGAPNASDYCNISFDINSNKEIDADIDFGYESPTVNYDICSYYFLDGASITHCTGHSTIATFSESFSPSIYSSTPHTIWDLTISKEELNQTRNLSFIVKTIDKGQFRTYPTNVNNTDPILFYFNKTLNFKW